ncbi:MFS transporter [Mycobacterium seoulense]|uniref:Putative proline/betaine transporter n=1 Tax=Mycobacterium seoulense TaxID=386911 RepID=A0A7I7P246_9MYCO|nr:MULTISPECIES: MFS transporter [Mycobacterium]MCV7437544.1 MHS family MFS transporter [Mycobacterium seoulense]BBY02564.1 MFS transporter [Mycobacterium seoulense]
MTVRNDLRGKLIQSPAYLRRVVAASMAGTVVEWYEFFLYGTAATLVFSKVFFPRGGNELDAILAAFVTYAVGFAARPLGGIVFGQFGDRYGRKKLLQLSLLLVGVSTFAMGCLPTFAQIGYWAPALLVVLRFLQGFAVGGEWGGAILLVAEHSPKSHRGFWASWPQAGVPGGNMLATVVLLVLTSTLSDAAFLGWGWRVGFWLSAVVVLIGYYIRTKVTDAPIFYEAQRQDDRINASRLGVIEVLKRYPRGVFTAMGMRLGENTMYYLVVTFSITYLKVHVHADTKTILWWLLAAHAVHFAVIPLAGSLSDRLGRRPIYFIGALCACTWGFFAFPMMNSGRNAVIMSAIVIGLVFHGLMYAVQPAAMAEMFPTRMRYSGVSLGYQVTSILAGSLAPIIAVRLLETYRSAVPIAWYLAATAAVSALAVLAAAETKGIDLAALDSADARRQRTDAALRSDGSELVEGAI